MSTWQGFTGLNRGYVLELYERFRRDPASVDADTRALFERWVPPADVDVAPEEGVHSDLLRKAIAAVELAQSIRRYGHLAAQLDPLGKARHGDPSLAPETHAVTEDDLRRLPASLIASPVADSAATMHDVVDALRRIYCSTTGYDYAHVFVPQEREWLRQAAELGRFRAPADPINPVALLERLTQVEVFERFLHRTFQGKTRFSIEGLDMLVPILDELIGDSAEAGTRSILIGMAHRGRLNVMAHVLNKPYAQILAEFKDPILSKNVREDMAWTGDVKYHAGAHRAIKDGREMDLVISMPPNPSHLEAVDPIVEGMARAAGTVTDRGGAPVFDPARSLPVLIHGDAAFPGQGIVAETLNLSRLPGYDTGGTIHIIVNNQLGFTADARDSYSTSYASGLARGFKIPIVHVNADDPEACVEAARLAVAYRSTFNRDFLIDLIGYRRHGHNEGDEPSFTQPLMYQKIADHPTVRQIWAQTLVARGVVDPELPDRLVAKYTGDLQQAMDALQPEQDLVEPLPAAPPPGAAASAHSAVPLEQLAELNAALLRLPEGFTIHRKLERGRDRRAQALANPDERTIDWSTAEELAFASILADGISIRLTGEDVERGTFSHRHAVFHDVQTGGLHVPLQSLPQGRAAFEVHNSPLSENAVLGFEYGYNVQEPSRLVIWEAQYGDFINGAQVIIDEFIASARVKWGQQPSLVLLLPHAHEGQGPDHASARPERFLQLAADINIRIANCTTAAQYFHLLRRQASLLLKDPLPLVVLTPKSLLRHPLVASTPRELAESRFRMVIDDEDARGRAAEIRRVVICSGKMYVDLAGSALRSGRREVAICRLEQLYPLPMRDLRAMLDGYGAAHEIVWVQEEPENMGAWEFVRPHLVDVANGRPVRSIARPRSASPAEGSAARHARQQLLLIEAAFAEPRPGRAMAGSRPATEQVAG
ncbi:MAG: 2-oxoglutarate dehydrogenase E1 component [Acidobacteria bacterium]|nr:2-oxoglutarate dehydrogenase E1 component [Acidobacteriota bacterium]